MPLDPDTSLARFLFSDEVNASWRVKPVGFMPHWHEPLNRFEFSTYDVKALPVQSVFGIAQGVEEGRRRTCKGWALLPAQSFWAQNLGTEPDDDPPRHVTVVGWPPKKEGQKLIAIKLAAECTEAGGFEPRPPNAG